MKKVLCLLSIISLGFTASAQIGQTNTPPPSILSTLGTASVLDLLTNVPTASNFLSASVEISLGAVADGSGTSFKNSIELQKNFGSTFLAACEIQNGTASSIIESAGLFAGIRKAGSTWELYGMAGGRRDWANAQWDAVVTGGVAWGPCYAEESLVMQSLKGAPHNELKGGLRFKF